MGRHFSRVLTLCLVLCECGFAQPSSATLSGTVSDAAGTGITGVFITITNSWTGISITAQSNEGGAYLFSDLRPGKYAATASLLGYRPQTFNEVIVNPSQERRLDFKLARGYVDQPIETMADGLTGSTSVGSVLAEFNLRYLPSGGGNALDLVAAVPGIQGSSFAGGRVSQVNTTRDGISVSDGRYENGVFSQTYMSTDLVNEIRILVAPADAEIGRGSGQVRLSTRSGTNEFHGSAFWANRNSIFDANNWFNNFNGIKKDYLNRNQFGFRMGGPIVPLKTFFFALYEGMRTVQKSPVVANVLTQDARRGNFRYFPGVQNGNAISSTPTVDLQGNPVRPAIATGNLSFFNLFDRDPQRNRFDPTGQVQRIIAKMPLPNDFTVGDGLNRAGYRWVRRSVGTEDFFGNGVDINRDVLNLRLDHHINASHRLTLGMSREHAWADASLSNWPGGYNGQSIRHPKVYTGSLMSVLSKTLVNEFRSGLRRGRVEIPQAYDVPGQSGEEARKYLGYSNGMPYIIKFSDFLSNNVINDTLGSLGNTTPLYTFGDTLTWSRGKHILKGGFEVRFGANNAWNSNDIIPRVNLGLGVPVTGIDASVPGLTGMDQTNARVILSELAGSVAFINEAFSLAPDPKNIVFKDYRELYKKYRDIRQNEWGAFFKDDWRVTPNLSLGAGLRYEYYGVPYESHGLTAAPVGGGATLINGSTAITAEFVGKNSPQPDKQLYQDDWNNFAPSVGLSWSIPYFGYNKTVLRMGYGVNYQGGSRGLALDVALGLFPGVNQYATHPSTTYTDLTNLSLPIPERAPNGSLLFVPLTARNDTIFAWDPKMVSPYIQNWTMEIQRETPGDSTVQIRYIGSKGTKLFSTISQNDLEIQSTGILEAYNITRAGGQAPLFDQMLMNLNIPGFGVVNGNSLTGSAALRTISNTRPQLANSNQIRQFVLFLNNTAQFTGAPGGLLRNAGLPENFIVKNPQFLTAYLLTNPASSTYHALQVGWTKRWSHGFAYDASYTWSRALGEWDSDDNKIYADPANRSRDKALLSSHRTHDLRSNGTIELPLGPGRPWLNGGPRFISRLVENWQLGAMFGLTSGQPLSLAAGTTLSGTMNYPDVMSAFPKSSGKVVKVSNGVVYWDELHQVPDPTGARVTPEQQLNTQFNLRALADSQGRIVLQNPAPGLVGTLGRQALEGPGRLGFDLSLMKTVLIAESKNVVLGFNALNVLNHPQFGNPNVATNNTNFGRITSATGNRQFTMNARFNF